MNPVCYKYVCVEEPAFRLLGMFLDLMSGRIGMDNIYHTMLAAVSVYHVQFVVS